MSTTIEQITEEIHMANESGEENNPSTLYDRFSAEYMGNIPFFKFIKRKRAGRTIRNMRERAADEQDPTKKRSYWASAIYRVLAKREGLGDRVKRVKLGEAREETLVRIPEVPEDRRGEFRALYEELWAYCQNGTG